jgi:hypothetical protein
VTATLTAKFDGKALLPESPVDLKPDARYVLLVKEELPAEAPTADPWDVIESLIGTVPGPEDWARSLEHYLYGVPKKEDRQ